VNSPPPKPEVILTNFFAEPTVLLVPITSCDNKVKSLFGNERSAQTQTECNVNNVITVETQTEPVIPISNKKRY
jgi:hypothetical protein